MTLLWQIEIAMGQSKSAQIASREAGISERELQQRQATLILGISPGYAADNQPIPPTPGSGRAHAINSPSRWYKMSVRPAAIPQQKSLSEFGS